MGTRPLASAETRRHRAESSASPIALASLFIVAGIGLTPPVVAHLAGLEVLSWRANVAVWSADLTCVAWGGLSLLLRRHRALANVNLLLVSLALLVVGTEAALRLNPELLGRQFATGVLSKYHMRPGGIYYYDPAVRMKFMIPNLTTTMYYNGYVWEHSTDALGFRNRELMEPSDVVLLGDSMIYGHGVTFEDTLGHQLARRTGLTVANLARQADCFLHYAYLLAEYAPRFRPRHVVVFFTDNDISDLYGYRREEELRQFAETPVSAIRYPQRLSVEAGLAQQAAKHRRGSLRKRLHESLYVVKIYDWIRFRLDHPRRVAVMKDPARIHNPNSLGWRYARKALMYMKGVSTAHLSRLTLVTLPSPDAEQCVVLHKTAEDLGIDHLDACHLWEANPSWFLPGDNHLSAVGDQAMAALVAAHLHR